MINIRFAKWCAIVSLFFWLSACGLAQVPDAATMPHEAADTVLHEVANRVCPLPDDLANPDLYHDFSTSDTALRFDCLAAAGHNTTTTLQWFSSQTETDAAFEERREGRIVTEFHGFPLLMWGEDHPSFPGGRQEVQIWLWQADQWLIEIRAFDDTHFAIAPHPETVADAIYQIGQEHGLFTASD